ncbi:enoyl-CoA hydratase/isomerase family protein [Aquabacterium humicola]|uniref:enoyl-CoA hydratase/isomerase family protein n=1 Tax=Aquabacterium humicola TaxID=3237377 RepID=UPI002543A396|nr:enoyl-CoA hydratase-related protein [Rubrivivax pictus]
MNETVLVDVADGVATITLNRPQARNALDAQMKDALAALVPSIVADDAVRAVILTGAGGAFCAGGDLRGMAEVRPTMDFERWQARMREFQPWLTQLIELDRPLIAAVDGPAYGAGFGLALAADVVLASPRARFCLSFMKVGLGPDFGAMYTLPRVVGVQRAKELMLSAREVGAEEAQRLGLVMELHPEDRLLDRARALARSFVDASPVAVRHIKQDVARSLASDLPTMLALEAEHQARCFDTAYQADAVERFLAKQPPRFQWPPTHDDDR